MGEERIAHGSLDSPVGAQIESNAALQAAILDAIAAAKGADPLAPVTLLVPNRSLAWQLRRQLARRLPAGAALAGVNALTELDFLDTCALALGLTPATTGDRIARAAVLEAALRGASALGVSAEHPQTATRLGRVLDDLRWCRLDADQMTRLAEVATPTLITTVEFIRQVRSQIAQATGAVELPHLADQILASHTSGAALPPGLAALGTLIVVHAHTPAPVRQVLTGLALPVTWLRIHVDGPAVPAEVRALPDPATEAALAVRCAVEAIDAGRAPEQIAILYSTGVPYAALLEHALNDAGVAWHGPTPSSLRQTVLARRVDTLLELAGELAEGGPQRTTLMRWLALRPARATADEPVAADLRDLIRSAGLYGDVRNWSAALQVLAQRADDESDEDEDPRSRSRQRLRATARHLDALLGELLTHLRSMVDARTWDELATALAAAVHRYSPGTGLTSAAQAAAHTLLDSLLQDSLPQIDALNDVTWNASLLPSPQTLRALIDREFDQARASHGDAAVGIHVGPVASTRCLTFEQVIVIGAADGLLPSVRNPNPLLSDAARLVLRTELADAPTVVEIEAGTRRDVLAVASGATAVLATYPRGAIPTSGVAKPSRYFRSTLAEEQSWYLSYRHALRTGPLPVTERDLAACRPAEDPATIIRLKRTVDSLHAWARPSFDAYFGNIGASSSHWDIGVRPLSASAIETYLHCPYGFFVDRILGFSTDTFEDEVEEISARDLGLLLHECLEELVRVAAEHGWLPGPGEPWPANAAQQAIEIFSAKATVAQAQGLTGWPPAWRATYQEILLAIPQFFQADLELRSGPPMAPGQPEVAFGFAGQREVPVQTSSGALVRLRGAIDRLDITEDGFTARVIDYKTGKSKSFERILNKGAKIQHLVYSAAVQTLLPNVRTPLVSYLFIPNEGHVESIDAPLGDDPRSALVSVLNALDEAALRGSFPPRTTGGRDFCPVCSRLGRRAVMVSDQAGATEVQPLDNAEAGDE